MAQRAGPAGGSTRTGERVVAARLRAEYLARAMSSKSKRSRSISATVSTGLAALEAGDLDTARQLLSEARQARRRDPGILVNLGLALERSGEIDEATRVLGDALALKPRSQEIARRFSSLVRRFNLSDPGSVPGAAIKAALEFDTLDRQPIVELAIAHCLAGSDLSEAIASAQAGKAEEAAHDLLGKSVSRTLGSELLLQALQRGKNTDPVFERLLAAVRRLILSTTPASRFSDERDLYKLFLALIAQTNHNEHVWPVTEAETRAVDELQIDEDRLLEGDIEQSRRLGLHLLYRHPADTPLRHVAASEASGIRPKPMAALVAGYVREREEEADIAQTIPRVGSITDPVSLKVAGQYEKSPYPRWTSLHMPRAGALRRYLTQLTSDSALQFMDAPFEVLIAGCGTGHQAAVAAASYGENARVLGIDLSLPSLAYGRRMCTAFGIENVEFAQADLRDVALLGKQFEVIECVGVLHHTADPFAGWSALLDQLKPGGLMYIGLYSAVSRANIKALRNDPAYPFPGCSDDEARAFRALLMARQEGEPGAELRASGDFYSLSEFRDLVLHESEQHVTLPQIEAFLEKAGLTFLGFALSPHSIEEFTTRFPKEALPGSLSRWAELEDERPRLFDGMYLFWCARAA